MNNFIEFLTELFERIQKYFYEALNFIKNNQTIALIVTVAITLCLTILCVTFFLYKKNEKEKAVIRDELKNRLASYIIDWAKDYHSQNHDYDQKFINIMDNICNENLTLKNQTFDLMRKSENNLSVYIKMISEIKRETLLKYINKFTTNEIKKFCSSINSNIKETPSFSPQPSLVLYDILPLVKNLFKKIFSKSNKINYSGNLDGDSFSSQQSGDFHKR